MFCIKSKLKIPSDEKKYDANIDLVNVFPLLGYEAIQINITNIK